MRTGDSMGMVDDNYFGPPKEPAGSGRYTGGYSQDPKAEGGFRMNWESYADDKVVPLRLPKDPSVLSHLGDVDLAPDISDTGQWWMSIEDTIEYRPDMDDYPVGTVMPSVLVEGPFRGDRGDVVAAASWAEGVWRIETRRRLRTGSEYDVEIFDGTFLWVSVFDHAQTSHSSHLHPVALRIERKCDDQAMAQDLASLGSPSYWRR